MNGRRRLALGGVLLVAAAATAVVVIVVAALRALDDGRALLLAASDAVGRPVRAARTAVGMGLDVPLTLAGVRVDGVPVGVPLLTIEHATLRLRLLPLLRHVVRGDPARYLGAIAAGPGTVGGIRLDRLAGRLEIVSRRIVLEEAHAELLGGRIDGRIDIEAGAGGLDAELTAADLDLAVLPADAERPLLLGRLAGQLDLAGPAPSHPAFRLALRGTGRFEVARGLLGGLPVTQRIQALATRLVAEEALADLAARHPDVLVGEALRFAKLTGRVRIARGRLHVETLTVSAPSYEAEGAGTIGIRGGLDLNLRIALAPTFTTALIGERAMLAHLTDARGRLVVPVRLRGPLAHPRLLPEPRFATAVSRAARGAAAGPGADVIERLLRRRRHRAR